jgi:hypothetical protein
MSKTIVPYTQLEILEIMIAETQNEINKTHVLERLAQRQNVRGIPSETAIAALQRKIKPLEASLADLKDFHKEELAKKPLEYIVKE